MVKLNACLEMTHQYLNFQHTFTIFDGYTQNSSITSTGAIFKFDKIINFISSCHSFRGDFEGVNLERGYRSNSSKSNLISGISFQWKTFSLND